jgi:hypothetical protein
MRLLAVFNHSLKYNLAGQQPPAGRALSVELNETFEPFDWFSALIHKTD